MNLFGHTAPSSSASGTNSTINTSAALSTPLVSDINSTPADNKNDEITPVSSIDSDAKSIKPTPLKDIADLDNLDDIEEYLNSLNG